MSTTTIENLQADFELLDDWEERYRYVIELGRLLPPFDEKFRNAQYKVSGCASQVWIHAEHNGSVLTFTGDSDALIVKGLIAITFMIFSGKTPAADPGTRRQRDFRQAGPEGSPHAAALERAGLHGGPHQG